MKKYEMILKLLRYGESIENFPFLKRVNPEWQSDYDNDIYWKWEKNNGKIYYFGKTENDYRGWIVTDSYGRNLSIRT